MTGSYNSGFPRAENAPCALRQYARQSRVALNGDLLEYAVFDAEYLARLKHGDLETGRHFNEYFGNVIWLKLRNRVRASHLIDEIRQETFARVLKFVHSGREIEHPERFGAFVLGVCNNVMLEVLRCESHHIQSREDAPDLPDESTRTDANVVTGERQRAVRLLLQELPEKDRALLHMLFLEEVDRSTLSHLFKVDGDYLRVLVHRAKERFREIVRKRGAAVGL